MNGYDTIIDITTLDEELTEDITYVKMDIEGTAMLTELVGSVALLEQAVCELYGQPVILLLDEYDTPLMGSHQYGYHDRVSAFIAYFYGSALKGQQALWKR